MMPRKLWPLLLLAAILLTPAALADDFLVVGAGTDGTSACLVIDENMDVHVVPSCDVPSKTGMLRDVAVGARVGTLTVCAGVHLDPQNPTAPYACLLHTACTATDFCGAIIVDREMPDLPFANTLA